jgi:hypothetical protein
LSPNKRKGEKKKKKVSKVCVSNDPNPFLSLWCPKASASLYTSMSAFAWLHEDKIEIIPLLWYLQQKFTQRISNCS